MNNRQVKFRVWNARNNNFMAYPGDGKLKEVYFDGKEWDEKRDGVLMEWTGLKDKNGKDIYEGDLIIPRDPLATLIVEYSSKNAEFVAGALPINSSMINFPITVVGNIFENPELIDIRKLQDCNKEIYNNYFKDKDLDEDQISKEIREELLDPFVRLFAAYVAKKVVSKCGEN